MAVQHHLDQPLMSVNEIDISPGFESQVCSQAKLRYVHEQSSGMFTSKAQVCSRAKLRYVHE